jgi:GDP/UDP-N,N'-diacetylbacillosamine 2-epimerase (hydrolysing)
VTLEHRTAAAQIDALLAALDQFTQYSIIFTLPNADADGRIIADKIRAYVTANGLRTAAFASLGQQRYLSLLKHVAGVVGNSSSGIIEAPSFGIPTVDIGDRQKGRIAAASVVHSEPDTSSIVAAMNHALSEKFRGECAHVENPYGDGETSSRIVARLKTLQPGRTIKKTFYDIPPGR